MELEYPDTDEQHNVPESIDIANPDLSPDDRIELLKILALPSETITECRARRIAESIDLIGKHGELIFKPEDIYETTDFLAKIVRMYFVDNDITYDYLKIMHMIYCESLCMLPSSIHYDRNNFKRAIVKPTMTKPFFEKVFNILGVSIVDVAVTLLDSNKQSVIYHINK